MRPMGPGAPPKRPARRPAARGLHGSAPRNAPPAAGSPAGSASRRSCLPRSSQTAIEPRSGSGARPRGILPFDGCRGYPTRDPGASRTPPAGRPTGRPCPRCSQVAHVLLCNERAILSHRRFPGSRPHREPIRPIQNLIFNQPNHHDRLRAGWSTPTSGSPPTSRTGGSRSTPRYARTSSYAPHGSAPQPAKEEGRSSRLVC